MCLIKIIVIFQSLSRVWLFATPWNRARHASLSFAIFQSLFKHVHWVVMLSNYLTLCRLLLLLPSIFPSIRVFSNELALRIRCPKYWSFSFSIIPFNEYSRLISFKIHWFDLLAVQGTLKSLLQHNSKASVLQCSAFFMIQLSGLRDCACTDHLADLALFMWLIMHWLPGLSYTDHVVIMN